MRTRISDIRGLPTAWLDNENQGRPIALFLHGYLDSPAGWEEQSQAFSADYRVIIPYVRGVGPSEPPSDRRRYGVHSILLDHLEVLRRVDPAGELPVHLVGHDFGGVHAWMLACHPKPSFKTVAIINSVHPKQYLRRMLWPRQVMKSWYVGALQVPWLSEAALWVIRKPLLAGIEAEGWRAPEERLTLEGFEDVAVHAVNQYREFLRDVPRFLREQAEPTPVPALVISSEGDRYLEEPSVPEFSDIAKNVVIRVVRGKHWLQREQPERVNRLLSEFWNAHP